MPIKIERNTRPSTGHNGTCPVTLWIGFLHSKWMLPLLFELFSSPGPKRFSELQRALNPITPKILTARLVELKKAGYLQKRTISNRETTYSLTKESAPLKHLVAFFKASCARHSAAAAARCASCPEGGRCLTAYGVRSKMH